MSPLITRAVAVDPDGGVRELDLGAGAVQMDALCRAIGSTLDMLTPQLLMWVDDEGVVNGSAVNTVATERPGPGLAVVPAQPLAGDDTVG